MSFAPVPSFLPQISALLRPRMPVQVYLGDYDGHIQTSWFIVLLLQLCAFTNRSDSLMASCVLAVAVWRQWFPIVSSSCCQYDGWLHCTPRACAAQRGKLPAGLALYVLRWSHHQLGQWCCLRKQQPEDSADSTLQDVAL